MNTNLRVSIPYQPLVERLLNNALSSGRIHSSYLFTGMEGYGKWDTAVRFASQILSLGLKSEEDVRRSANNASKLIHPDLHVVFPMPSPKNNSEDAELVCEFRATKQGNPFAPVNFGRVSNILVDKVRELKYALYKTSAEGGYRVAIFQQVEVMPATSFDILLKTIEEPPPQTVLLLLTNNVRRLPLTVLSRCQRVRFRPVPSGLIAEYLVETAGLEQNEAARIAGQSGGSFTEALNLAEHDTSDDRDAALSLIEKILNGDRAGLVDTIDSSVGPRDRDRALAIVNSVQSLLRDAYAVRLGAEPNLLLNPEIADRSRAVAQKIARDDAYQKCLAEAFETQKLFYRNVPNRLALMRMAWNLKKIISGASSPSVR